MSSHIPDAADRQFVHVRVFDASPQQIFRAFEPDHLARWWGPEGFTNTIHSLDFTPGGRWVYTMHGPKGTNYDNECEFVEILPPQRIVLRHLLPVHTFELSFTLAPAGDGRQTELTWVQRFDTKDEADRVRAFVPMANEQNLDRLGEELKRIN